MNTFVYVVLFALQHIHMYITIKLTLQHMDLKLKNCHTSMYIFTQLSDEEHACSGQYLNQLQVGTRTSLKKMKNLRQKECKGIKLVDLTISQQKATMADLIFCYFWAHLSFLHQSTPLEQRKISFLLTVINHKW